jgi:hypothetical protein
LEERVDEGSDWPRASFFHFFIFEEFGFFGGLIMTSMGFSKGMGVQEALNNMFHPWVPS